VYVVALGPLHDALDFVAEQLWGICDCEAFDRLP